MSHETLTAAQAERLEMLAEEASEVVQICMKILRHGYGSYHPDNPHVDNKTLLHKEVYDFSAVWGLMVAGGEASDDITKDLIERVIKKKLLYTHHQQELELGF